MVELGVCVTPYPCLLTTEHDSVGMIFNECVVFFFPFLTLPLYDFSFGHPDVGMRNKDYFYPLTSLT